MCLLTRPEHWVIKWENGVKQNICVCVCVCVCGVCVCVCGKAGRVQQEISEGAFSGGL